MQMTYETFKIILGLLASVFILSFFIYYAGVYSQIEGDIQESTTVKNFIKTVEDVYISGNPIGFYDFSKISTELFYNPSGPAAEFGFGISGMPLTVPVFLATGAGKEFYIHRGSVDYGWWKFYYILALPELDIIFNIQENDDNAKTVVDDMVQLFPSTVYAQPKIRFGFCDGFTISNMFDQYEFLGMAGSLGRTAGCSAFLNEKQRIVAVSNRCNQNFSGAGICVSPIDRKTGYVFADNETYIYKDPLDLVVLLLGSGQRNIYGKMSALIFEYKNKVFLKELIFASRVAGLRAMKIAQSIQPSYSVSENCRPLFVRLSEKLTAFRNMYADYYKLAPNALAEIEHVQKAMDDSKSAYDNLVNMGCELP